MSDRYDFDREREREEWDRSRHRGPESGHMWGESHGQEAWRNRVRGTEADYDRERERSGEFRGSESFGRDREYGGGEEFRRESGYEDRRRPDWDRRYGREEGRSRQFNESRYDPHSGQRSERGREHESIWGEGRYRSEQGFVQGSGYWSGNPNAYGYGGGYSSYGGGMGGYGQPGRFSGRGPKGWQRSDERIREDVNEHLTRSDQIDATEIDVQVNQGQVTLTGTVPDRNSKRLAEDIAERVSGVKDVHNQLRIEQQEHQQEVMGAAHSTPKLTGESRK